MPGQNLLGGCNALFPVGGINSIEITWSATGTHATGDTSSDGTGNGGGTAVFTLVDGTSTPATTLQFCLAKQGCARFFALLPHRAFSCGTYHDESGPTCSNDTDPVPCYLDFEINGATGEAGVTVQSAGGLESCINTGMGQLHAAFHIAYGDIIGTHTLTTTGGSFGGTWSTTVTVNIS